MLFQLPTLVVGGASEPLEEETPTVRSGVSFSKRSKSKDLEECTFRSYGME